MWSEYGEGKRETKNSVSGAGLCAWTEMITLKELLSSLMCLSSVYLRRLQFYFRYLLIRFEAAQLCVVWFQRGLIETEMIFFAKKYCLTSNLFPIGAGRTHRLAPYEARKRFFFFSLAMLIHSLLRNNFRLSFSIFISISLSECSAHKRQTDSNSLFKKKYQYTSDHRETWWDDECEGKEKRKARHKIWPFSHSPSFQNSRSKNEYIFYYKLRSHS